MKAKAKKPQKRSGNDFFSFSAKHMSQESVRRADAKAKTEIINLRLGELRDSLGIKQTEVPGFNQPSVSKIESREDIKLSTLLQYLEGLNLDVEITVHPKGKNKKDDEIELLKTGS